MKIIEQWATIMGTHVYVTDENVRYIVGPNPRDSAGNVVPGVKLVEAYQADNPDRKFGMAYVPADAPIEQWGPAIWGARPPRVVRRATGEG